MLNEKTSTIFWNKKTEFISEMMIIYYGYVLYTKSWIMPQSWPLDCWFDPQNNAGYLKISFVRDFEWIHVSSEQLSKTIKVRKKIDENNFVVTTEL